MAVFFFFFLLWFVIVVLVWHGSWVTDLLGLCVCVMGFGSLIWFWFMWVLVWHDESAGGFKSGLRLGLLGWWVLAMVLWRFCGGFWLRFVPWVFFFFIYLFFGG